MKEFLKKNFIILLAFALPLLVIGAVTTSVFLSARLVSTDYDFIYASCVGSVDYYPNRCREYLKQRYLVDETGHLTVREVSLASNPDDKKIPTNEANDYDTHLFFHNTAKNESREVTLAEVKTLNLNRLLTSPDGVTISSNTNQGSEFIFPFGGRSSAYGYYLTVGKSRQRLNLINDEERYSYRDNWQFIGWVLPGRHYSLK